MSGMTATPAGAARAGAFAVARAGAFAVARAGALAVAFALVTVVAGTLAPAAVAAPRTCPPGFIPNPYNTQCLAPVSTPTINGVPCVPSNLGLCSSFVQNQQPPRVPKSSVG